MSFRIEQKLQVAPGALSQVLTWIADNGGVVLHPERRINSVYFDTDDLRLFRDSHEGSVPRKKIRIRCYGTCDHTAGEHSLEVKVSSVEGRFKIADSVENYSELLESGHFDADYGLTRPVLSVTYGREYFWVHGVRLTVDRDIVYSENSATGGPGYRVDEPRIAVELKADDATSIDRLLDLFPFPRVRFSKYSNAVIALNLDAVSI